MKKKSIFNIIMMALVVAFLLPVGVIFAACDQNPPAACEVVFVIDGRKQKTAEIDKFGDLSVEQANELFNESKTGYSLDGWYTDSELTNKFEGTTNVGDKVVLYGTYVINEYTITFVLNNGSQNITQTYYYDQQVETPLTPERTGYTFDGWDKEIPEAMPAENLTIEAKWQINSYTITFVLGNGQPDIEETLDFGDTISAPTNLSREGYAFVGWDKEIPATMPDEDLLFSAVWNINTYTITFDSNGGSPVEPISLNFGEVVDAPADPTRKGYAFDGWDKDIPETMPAENLTITAIWQANAHTATFVLNNGQPNIVLDLEYGDAIVAPTGLAFEGHEFDHWSPEVPDKIGDEDLTFAAVWSTNCYTLTYVLGHNQDNIEEEYNFGETIVPQPNPSLDGYTFTGWDAEIPATMPSHDITVTAQWEVNEYTITFDTDGGNSIDPITDNYGVAISKPANPTKTGYTFAGWQPAIPITMPAENMTVVAIWQINTYNLTFDLDGKGENTVVPYEYGAQVESIANPSHEGYTFGGWDIAIPTTMPAHDVTLHALWTVKQFSITYVLGNGQDNITNQYDYNQDVTAPADPARQGYTFAGWDAEIPTKMPAQNMTISANWTANDITITFNSNGGSDVAAKTQKCGTEVQAPEEPTKTNYTFSGWYQDDQLTIPFAFPNTMPTEDTILYAKWTEAGKYTITFMVDGAQYGSLLEYHAGETIVLPTQPTKTGYDFDGWDPTVPETMPAENLVVSATWKAKTYTITVLNHDDTTWGSESYSTGEVVTAPAGPSRDYYTFDGWLVTAGEGYWTEAVGVVLDAGESTEKETALVYGNFTLKATYTPIEYTIAYAGIENATNPNTTTVYTVESEAIVLLDATKTGYTFGGWYANETKYEQIAKGSHGDLTLTATWTAIDYAITYHLNGGTNSANNPATYTIEDSTIVFENPTKDYYTFGGWFAASTCEPATAITQIEHGSTGAVEIWALWTPTTYTISFDANGGNPVGSVEYNIETETFDLPSATREGYHFDGWFVDDTQYTQIEKGSHQNLALVAHWTIEQYTLTLNFANSEDDPVVLNLDYNEEISEQLALIDEPIKRGCYFTGWLDGNEEELPDYMPAQNISVTATYAENSDMADFVFVSTKTTCTITGIKNDRKATIEQVIVPSYVTNINQGAFSGCSNISLLDVPFIGASADASGATTEYWAYPFYATGSNVPSDLENYTVGKSSYYIPNKLTKLRISSIGSSQNAFPVNYATTITDVYFKGTIEDWCALDFGSASSTTFGRSPMTQSTTTNFWYLQDPKNQPTSFTKLVELTIPTTVRYSNTGKYLGPWVFAGIDSLTKVTIPVGVQRIAKGAFANCKSLTTVVILETGFSRAADEINTDAFSGCDALQYVFFDGDATQWASLSSKIKSNFNGATIYYYLATEPEEGDTGNYWHYINNEISIWPNNEPVGNQ